jgi:small subunit ribosomal protein S2
MRNLWMSQYIYGHRLGVDIIDFDKSLSMLHSALNFLAHIAYRQGIILFLRPQSHRLIHFEIRIMIGVFT